MSMWEADQIYGGVEINKPARITDAILTEDRDGNPILSVWVEIGHKADNPRNPAEGGGEPIYPGEEEIRLFLGLDDDEKSTKRRGISLDQIAAISGVRLEDSPESLLKLLPETADSVISKIVGQTVWLKGNESNGKVYLNLYVPRQKPQTTTLKELRAKIKARRERG